MKIYFWGTGKGCKKALQNYIYGEEISGYIDNNPEQWGKSFQGKRIVSFEESMADAELIVITAMQYDAILYQIKKSGFGMEKVFCYFEAGNDEETVSRYFDGKGRKIDLLERRLEDLENIVKIRFSNIGYEIADNLENKKYQFPILHSDEEAFRRIIDEKCSLIRFGDGEFELMAGKERAPFQKYEKALSERLREVIQSRRDNLLIALANNYGSLDLYTESDKDGIRGYMTEEVRAFHASLLDYSRVYYDAYLFKCYFLSKDRDDAERRYASVKRIWQDRDVVLIEGAETRTGQGNDLLDNARSVQRILCPTQNAYGRYQDILEEAKRIPKDKLVLCVLGPAGKVLAYDLIQDGYQVVDIGQVDMEYEWYRAGAGIKVPNPTKYVSQLPPALVEEIHDKVYESQIIAVIA
ncbi:MAG: DUF1792 domain-containing protein [Lachnospiraceae bacterium]|jgi:glycosyltransferase family protein|nr:GT-D fold domain-containing glycosyltransferase [uncultured Acetatifactor sp.]MCI9220007.1 DUF1792 domain-containing protein [Lachnospiraceae bacterium]